MNTVLLIEDNPGDARLIKELLIENGRSAFDLVEANRLEQGLDFLREGSFDLVLLDLGLPDSGGADTFFAAHRNAPSTPIVLLTGLEDDALALELLRSGAQDFIQKDTLDGRLLTRSLRYAAERARSDDLIRQLAKFPSENPNPVIRAARSGRILYANEAALVLMGTIGSAEGSSLPPELAAITKAVFDSQQITEMELEIGGGVYEFSFNPIPEGNYLNLYGRDITARVDAENQTRRRMRELHLLNLVITAAASQQEVVSVLEITCRELAASLNLPHAAAFLWNTSGEFVQLVSEYCIEPGPSSVGSALPIHQNSTLASLLKRKGVLAIQDAATDPTVEPLSSYISSQHLSSLLLVPLSMRDQLLGFLSLAAAHPLNFESNMFSLASSAASAAAQVIENTRLIEQLRKRLNELEMVAAVSTELREAANSDEMIPIILGQIHELFTATCTGLAVRDTQGVDRFFSLSREAGELKFRQSEIENDPLYEHVLTTRQPYVTEAAQEDKLIAGSMQLSVDPVLVCAPLITKDSEVGGLWVSRRLPMAAEDLRLIGALADIAANAIHRSSLHDQTRRQLHHLTALHTIDVAIASGEDLEQTISVFLEQVTGELAVEAAMVSVLTSDTKQLELVAAIGELADLPASTTFSMDVGLRGRAIQAGEPRFYPSQAGDLPPIHTEPHLMPNGFQGAAAVPLIAKGQVLGVLEIFCRAPIHPDPAWLEFLTILAGQAAIAIDNAQLVTRLRNTNHELISAYDATIAGWSRALELRDIETEGHSHRVADMTVRLATALDMTAASLIYVRWGALLHDIGKMGVPDQILYKPGPLTEPEWQVMRKHPIFAYEMLEPVSYLRPALDIPHFHHEKWDGSGYPRGLRESNIPLAARIFAVVDVWDALLSDRPYRSKWSNADAQSYISRQSGKHFDPQVVQIFSEHFWQ